MMGRRQGGRGSHGGRLGSHKSQGGDRGGRGRGDGRGDARGGRRPAVLGGGREGGRDGTRGHRGGGRGRGDGRGSARGGGRPVVLGGGREGGRDGIRGEGSHKSHRGGGRVRGDGRGGARGGRRSTVLGGGREGGRDGNRDEERDVGRSKHHESAMTNMIIAGVSTNFDFYQYTIDYRDEKGNDIESWPRREALFNLAIWDKLLADMPGKQQRDLKRVVFFGGPYFFSARPIPGLDRNAFPKTILDGANTGGDTFALSKVFHFKEPTEISVNAPTTKPDDEVLDCRCGECTKAFGNMRALLQHCRQTGHKPKYQPKGAIPAQRDVFLSYVNCALSAAFNERQFAKWGREYVDLESGGKEEDGITVYRAFSCEFGLNRLGQEAGARPQLTVTVDLRAKLERSSTVLDSIYDGKDPNKFELTKERKEQAENFWVGKKVINVLDQKCYTVVGLNFDQSADSLSVKGLRNDDGTAVSHADYFMNHKNQKLQFPNAKPMVTVLGRHSQDIYLPAELICGYDLGPRAQKRLPVRASFTPEERKEAIDTIKTFLVPDAQKTEGASGLLPAIGIQLKKDWLNVDVDVLPAPILSASGIEISRNQKNWTNDIQRANFDVDPCKAVTYNVVVFYNYKIKHARDVYNRIRHFVNGFNSLYRFAKEPKMIKAGYREEHWGKVETFFSGDHVPPNIFVLDFTKSERAAKDDAYPVVKQMLSSSGYLSQFVNFNTHQHDDPRDPRRSDTILRSVARQVLQKSGVRLWWVALPRSIPLPAVFVGVDVFHAPRKYNAKEKQIIAKASCAAIIVQMVRPGAEATHQVDIYSETFVRSPGQEYGLQGALSQAVSNALANFNADPMSCFVWRDGIGDSALDHLAGEEITGIRAGLKGGIVGVEGRNIPLAYIVCQKRIATKFLTNKSPDRSGVPVDGAPSGALVKNIQSIHYPTFYLQGRAPPFSTPKPVRFIVVARDAELQDAALPELTWNLCHDYPNWAGSIKVPSVCQMAHKLAELGGSFYNCGQAIDSKRFLNKVHFL